MPFLRALFRSAEGLLKSCRLPCAAVLRIGSVSAALALSVLPVDAADPAQDLLGFHLLHLDETPLRWVGDGPGPVTVTYAFADRPMHFAAAYNCQGLVPLDPLLVRSRVSQAQFREEVRAAFAMWEHVANISFRETDDAAASSIVIGAQEQPDGRAFTNVKPQPGHPDRIEKSLICLNPEQHWKVGFDGNLDVYDLRYSLAHEIGHAIGLDHPGSSGQVMFHRYQEHFRALQAGDIRGAVQLYGENGSNEPRAVVRAPEVGTSEGLSTARAAALR